MKILHIITSLDTGGAQWVFVQLARQLKERGDQQLVVSLKRGGVLNKKFTELEIPVTELDFSLTRLFSAVHECNKLLVSFQPDIVQSWLYHADFFTALLKNKSKTPIVWGLHHSYETSRTNRLKTSTKFIVRSNSLLSYTVPRKIICCSRSAMKSHVKIGYDESKMVYVPNGVDASIFKPDKTAQVELRKELGIPSETLLIGYIARFHPQKDHATFFSAAFQLLKVEPETHFVLAGDGITGSNPKICQYLSGSNYSSHFHFLGRRTDIACITAGLDIASLTSSGDEAFPLTIIEAMACGIPIVSTDVGDAREMIGICGKIVPVCSPADLCKAWQTLLQKTGRERTALGNEARERVKKYFTNELMALHYLEVYNCVNE